MDDVKTEEDADDGDRQKESMIRHILMDLYRSSDKIKRPFQVQENEPLSVLPPHRHEWYIQTRTAGEPCTVVLFTFNHQPHYAVYTHTRVKVTVKVAPGVESRHMRDLFLVTCMWGTILDDKIMVHELTHCAGSVFLKDSADGASSSSCVAPFSTRLQLLTRVVEKVQHIIPGIAVAPAVPLRDVKDKSQLLPLRSPMSVGVWIVRDAAPVSMGGGDRLEWDRFVCVNLCRSVDAAGRLSWFVQDANVLFNVHGSKKPGVEVLATTTTPDDRGITYSSMSVGRFIVSSSGPTDVVKFIQVGVVPTEPYSSTSYNNTGCVVTTREKMERAVHCARCTPGYRVSADDVISWCIGL